MNPSITRVNAVVAAPCSERCTWRSRHDNLRFVPFQILVQMFDLLGFGKVDANIEIEGVSGLETSFDADAGSASVATENLTNIMLTRIDLVVSQTSIRQFHGSEDPRVMFRPILIFVTITVKTLIARRVGLVLSNSGYIISAVVKYVFESLVSAVFGKALSVNVITWCLIWSWLWRFRFAFSSCLVPRPSLVKNTVSNKV